MIPCHGSSAIVPTFLPPKSIFPSFALNHPNSTSTRMLHPRNRHVLTFASRTPTSYPHPHEATPAVLPSLPPTPPPCFAPVSASTLAILSSLCPACGSLPLIASDPRRSISVCVLSRAVHFSSSSANERMCSFYPFAHAHFPTILIIFVWRRGSQRRKRRLCSLSLLRLTARRLLSRALPLWLLYSIPSLIFREFSDALILLIRT